MINLLEETIEELELHNKTGKDVLWVGDEYHATTWEEFTKIANFEYDDGYGSNEISSNLRVVGKNWWLRRWEYDGSEGWTFEELPRKPKMKKLKFHNNRENENYPYSGFELMEDK